MSGLTVYISEAAAGKKKTPQKWLADTVSLLSKCDMATHVGKFTHPDVKVYLQRKNKAGQNAYVLTENVDCETDIVYSSAAYMGAAKLLLYALDDGRPLWKHIYENDENVRREVEFGRILRYNETGSGTHDGDCRSGSDGRKAAADLLSCRRRDVSSVDRIAVLKPSASAERQKQEYEAAQV